MRPLGVVSAISGLLGVVIVAIAQLSISSIVGRTLVLDTPDLGQPTLWSWIGGALIGVGVSTLILELLMIEVREAIRTKGALRERHQVWSVDRQQAVGEAPNADGPV